MRRRVADIALLLLVLATGTLARYRRDIAGIGFADEASISAGSDHVGGKFQKSVGVKLPLLGELVGGSKQKGSKETGLDVIGGFGFKPVVKFQDGGIGFSVDGSAGAGFGTSNEDAIVGGDAGLGLSVGLNGISANFGGGVGAGGGKKHDGEYHHHGVWWEEHHQGAADSNGAEHSENNDQKTSGKIVIPIYDGSGSIGGSAHWTSGSGANNGDLDAGKIIELPHGDKGGSAGASGSAHVGVGESHDHGVIKGGAGIGGGIVISHGNSGQNGDKGHDRGNGNGHVHGGGGIIISHGGSKGHQGTSSGTRGDGKHGENGSNHIGGGIVISIGDAGQSSSDKGHENGNGHVHGGGGIIISHGGHGGSKGHEGTSKVNGTEGQKGGNESSHHAEGGGSIVISHGSGGQSNNNKEHNGNGSVHKGGGGVIGIDINHGKGGGKDINVTISVGHGGNQSGNSAGSGEGSGSREKHDWRWKNCGILNNRRCGSNVKGTLEFIRMFVRYCDAIVHFLLELKDDGLRSVLCRISPRSKLSCQLGCNILRVKPLLSYA